MHIESWVCDRCGQKGEENIPRNARNALYKNVKFIRISFIIRSPHFRQLGEADYCASCFVDVEAKIKRIIKERVGDPNFSNI